MKQDKHLSWSEFLSFVQQSAVTLDGWSKALQPTLTKIAEAIREYQPKVEEWSVQAAKVLTQLPEGQRAVLGLLANDGWYLEPEMGLADLSEAINFYNNNDFQKAREILCQHFTSTPEMFSDMLSNQFPERAEVLNAAIGAHSRGEYALSVPVFLAQADGICAEITGIQLYSKQNGSPKLASDQTIKNLEPFIAPFFYPLVVGTPITAGQKERSAYTDALNRHAVLHGEVSDYNTQINSCRALSLLMYTAWVFGMLRKFNSSQLKSQTNTKKEPPGGGFCSD